MKRSDRLATRFSRPGPVQTPVPSAIRNDRIGVAVPDTHGFEKGGQVEAYIHRENIALFRKKLSEPHTEKERKVLLELLAEAEAKLLRSPSAS